MMLSMTGFGAAAHDHPLMQVSVEMKSVNHRQFSLRVQMPARYSAYEIDLQRHLADRLQRGQVSLSVQVVFKDTARIRRHFNLPLLKSYLEDLRPLDDVHDDALEGIAAALLRLPEATLFTLPDPDAIQEEWDAILPVIEEAADRLVAFRQREGQALHRHIAASLTAIKEALAYVEQQQSQRLEHIQQTFRQRIEALRADEAAGREALEREIVLMLERLDISEEIARLHSHIQLFEETIPITGRGKKLGFIAQEMGREINTIASKARHADIQQQTILMKDHLERIKEQLANVL